MGDLDPVEIAFFLLVLIPSVILHEVMHGLVADRLGDPTAREAGRLTLNPIRHADPFGTILLPGMLLALSATGLGGGVILGYAKPVPIDPRRLDRPRPKMMLIAAAGPLTNAALALLAALLLRLTGALAGRATQLLFIVILVNAVLFVFNLLPLPPLDGSKILGWALPDRLRRPYLALDRYGFAILLLLLLAFPGGLAFVVSPVIDGLVRIVLA